MKPSSRMNYLTTGARYDYPTSVHFDLEDYYYWKFHCKDWDEAYHKLSGRDFDQLATAIDSIDNMPPKDVLSIYLEWNGINSNIDSIIEHYKDGDLEDYLNEEGIIGYTSDIKSILDQDKSLVIAHNKNYSVEKRGSNYNLLNKKNEVMLTSATKTGALGNYRRLSHNQPVRGIESPHSVYTWDVADRYGHVIRDDTPYPNVIEARNAARATAMADESIKGIYKVQIYRDGLFLEWHTFDK